jgi:hypothetical protein
MVSVPVAYNGVKILASRSITELILLRNIATLAAPVNIPDSGNKMEGRKKGKPGS